MYTMDSPVSAVFSAEMEAVNALTRRGYCSGLIWTRDTFLHENPRATLADLQEAFLALHNSGSEDIGAWVSGLLGNQWSDLPDTFRGALLPILSGDECLLVMKRARGKMTAAERSALRKQFSSVHPSRVSEFDDATKSAEADGRIS